MPLPTIVFNKGQGGLGRTPANKDHYSGLLCYAEELPAAYGTGVKKLPNLKAAEQLGITATATDDAVKALHYHVSQFFAVYAAQGVQPSLWVLLAVGPPTDFAEVKELSDYAAGEIRRVGVYTTEPFSKAFCDKLQAVVTVQDKADKPLSVILAADHAATSDLGSLPDLRTFTDPKVSVTIGQDGGAEGAALFEALGVSLTNLGSIMAWAGVKLVSENIGWARKFNVALGGEYDTPALANGDLVRDHPDELDDLNDKGYIFLRKYTGYSGTYFNDSHTCVEVSSDYAYMENNDVIDKAVRLARAGLIPLLNGPLAIDPTTGQLDPLTTADYENAVVGTLNNMVRDGELSGFKVSIDPEQDVLATSELLIAVELVINGVARKITVNIGFVKQLN